MKKILIFLGLMLIGLTLSACGDDGEITIPKYTGVSIDSISPEDGGGLVTFYKAKNDVVKVKITLDNPSDAEITSVMINGFKFFSARFDDESTNQLVSFDLSIGNGLGEVIYSIDEIFYADGSLSKSFLVNSNNSFKISTFKNVPTVERGTPIASNYSLQVPLLIEDDDDVIIPGSLVAELYSGVVKIDEMMITTGQVLVEFNDLSSNRNYEIRVRASYDLDDNNGLNDDMLLFSGVFVTNSNAKPVSIISNATVSSDRIVFNVSYEDTDNVTTEGSIYVGVFKDGELEEIIPLLGSSTSLMFNELLSDQEYEVKVLSDYNLNDGAGETRDNVLYTYTFSTLESIVPTPSIVNLKVDENRVSFDINIEDQANIIDKDTLIAKLYVNGELKQSAPIEEYKVDFQLYNLLSGFEFTVEIEASYDLNDGSPVRTNQIIFSENFTTDEKSVPAVFVSEVIAKQGYVILNLSVEDRNSTIQNALVATLYENDVAIQTIQFDENQTELVFNYLIQYEQIYSVYIVGNYNLQDGSGIKLDMVLFKTVLVTENEKAPVAEILNLDESAISIEADIRVMDSDETIVDDMIQVSVYTEGVLVESKLITVGTTHVIFENLMSDAEYWLVVSADYEVDDGSGIVSGVQIGSELIMTPEKEFPDVFISDLNVDTDSVTVYYDINDKDQAIVPGSLVAILTLNNVPVGEPWALDEFGNTAEITGLTSGLRYKVDIYADINLNDGSVQENDFLLDSSDTPIPEAKEEPTAELENIISDNNSITFDAIVIDDDDAIIDNLKAVLFKDGAITTFEIILVPGNNIGTALIDLEFGVEYELKIIADYTYNDGTPPFIGEELISEIVSTVPLVIIDNVIENDESITYTALLDDSFDITDSSVLNVAVYDQGDNLVGSVHTISSGTTMNIFNLWSDYDYYLIVTGEYSGTTGEVARYTFHTMAKEVQPLVITNLVVDDDEIVFDVNGVELPDSSGVIFDDVFVYLYEYDEDDEVYEIIDSEKLNDGDNSVTMDIDGFDGTQYLLQIEADINLNDSNGEYEDYVIHSQSFIYTEKNVTE